jgi:hypothetical protein
MVVNNKRGQCLVIDLIHILRFSMFIFFMALLCFSFTFGVQIIHVHFNLVHPQHFKSLKMDKKQGRYDIYK